MTEDTSLREKALRDEIPTWRCFHCDEVFHTRHAAQMHFGYTECSEPACRIKAGAEGSILEALRRAENDAELAIAAMHDESSEGWRAYHSIAGRVREQVDAAENLGYERDIRDEREVNRRRIEALEAENERYRQALSKIEKAPAWGYPERWETTPAEVRQLARKALGVPE